MKPVACPECIHSPFRDVGAFVNHMCKEHDWASHKSLIYWGDNYKAVDYPEEKEV